MREGEYGAVLEDRIEGGEGAHRACCPLTLNESFARMRNEGGGFAAFLEEGILVSQPSPRGEGAPQGRIGHRRHERQMVV